MVAEEVQPKKDWDRSFGWIRQIQEHLEAMQRDVHGIEYLPWKREVDDMWRRVFENVNRMSADTQVAVLEDIRETWTVYLTYYSDVSH